MRPVADVYGFNYDGSWGTSGLDLWLHHDRERMAVEIARGAAHFPHWNTARWWLSHEAFQRDPERFLGHLESGLAIFAEHGVAVVPVLFNRWRDPVCDFGGVPLDHLIPHASAWTRADDLFADPDPSADLVAPVQAVFGRYVDAVVGAHAGDDRIAAWDLCNEPLMGAYVDDPGSPVLQAELRWLRWLAARARLAGATQPLTIGNYGGRTAIRLTEPLVDLVSFHPYLVWNGDPERASQQGFVDLLDDVVAFAAAAGKPLLASETVWGARDDATHVEQLRWTLDRLVERGIGFTVHALHHSLVADLHRDEHGPVGEAESMHFIEADGTLRAGHEVFAAYAPEVRAGAR